MIGLRLCSRAVHDSMKKGGRAVIGLEQCRAGQGQYYVIQSNEKYLESSVGDHEETINESYKR